METTAAKPLGQILREWRSLLGLNQADAAKRCDLSYQHWWKLEHGRRQELRGTTFSKLAAGTGIPMSRLVDAAAVDTPEGSE
jgi:transcriptional regulator with XRE-family HTH domain